MKRQEIRNKVESHLRMVGIKPDTYVWSGADLVLFLAGRKIPLRLQSGMTQRALANRLGIISGIAIALDIKPQPRPAAPINRKRLNGSASINGKSGHHAHA